MYPIDQLGARLVKRNRVIVVLGMHRSGTSVVARALNSVGVYLGDHLLSPAMDNPSGYWEDTQITAANDRLLREHGFLWEMPGFDCAAVMERDVTMSIRDEIERDLALRFGASPLWGFKDPRVCILLPIWHEIFRRLDVDDNYVLVVRNPRSVAESLRARQGMDQWLAYVLWLEYMLSAVRGVMGKPRAFVAYDRMMDDPAKELDRLAEALALPPPAVGQSACNFGDSFLDGRLRHTRYTSALHTCNILLF